jgi:tetratricopeptide (TPR) repeat protein
VTYCRQAGARAYDRAAFREAAASFEQALQALAHLPEDGGTRGLVIDLRLGLGRSLRALGELGRHRALLGEAEVLAKALDDRARLGRVLAQMAQARRMTGDLDGAMTAGQQALDVTAVLGDSALRMEASYWLGLVYNSIGDFVRSAELLRSNVEAPDQVSDTRRTNVQISSRAWLAQTLNALGAFGKGRRHGEEALRLATLAGRGGIPVTAHGSLGSLYLARGELEQATRVLEQGLALSRDTGQRNWLPLLMSCLGSATALQGRLEEGLVLVEEAISRSIRTGAFQNRSRWVAQLSEVYRLAGRGEEAWQHARQALNLARQHKERGNEALALYQLGIVQAHATPPDVALAETHYQQALALAEKLGMPHSWPTVTWASAPYTSPPASVSRPAPP